MLYLFGSILTLVIGVRANDFYLIIQSVLFILLSIMLILNNIKLSKAEEIMDKLEKSIDRESI